MEVSREEMLEFGKMATFHLEDRLVPLDRETLRAEAWLQGHEMSKRFPLVNADQKDMEMRIEALQCELKTVRDELQKRDKLIKVLQQEPEPANKPDPVCGDMVEVHSTVDFTVAPTIALWYATDRNEQRKQRYHFITIDGKKFYVLANEVRLEHAKPDEIAYAIRQHLQSKAQENKEE
jgi:hypothetical protein